MDRRAFLQRGSLGLVAGAAAPYLTRGAWSSGQAATPLSQIPTEGAADDEAYWATIRAYYDPPTEFIDLDQANTGATPLPVFDAYVRRARFVSRGPAERFETQWAEDFEEDAKPVVARLLGADPKQVALVGSATVALNTVLRGFPLQPGDEILVTDHEYPDMLETIQQRARLHGVQLRRVAVPAPDEDGRALVSRVERAITSRTKLLLISQVSAWNAELLPVRDVTAAAKARGVAVLVDAAQSVGILDVSFEELGCDFLGASLHKAIGAPIASGVLIMKQEHIGRVEPLHPPHWESPEYPMDRYEWSGAFQLSALATAGDAVRFQERIGLAQKRARMRFLAERWISRVAEVPRIRLLTPRATERSIGAAAIAIDGIESVALQKRLREEFGILTQAKNVRHSPYTEALRISPAAHASAVEIDRLGEALVRIAQG